MGIDVALVFGVEELELAAARLDVEDGLAARDGDVVGRGLALAAVAEGVIEQVRPGVAPASLRFWMARERDHIRTIALVHVQRSDATSRVDDDLVGLGPVGGTASGEYRCRRRDEDQRRG